MTVDHLREERVSEKPTPLHELTAWKDRHGLIAGISTRGGDFDDFGLAGTAKTAEAIPRWLTFPHMLAGEFSTVCTGRQVHGTQIVTHCRAPRGTVWTLCDGVDGHATGDKGVLLTVTVADCVPIYLHAPDTGQLCLLHAGWRGVASGILQRGVDELAEGGSPPAQIVMHLGPAVCRDCYEVGPDVATRLGVPGATNRRVDLRAILAEQARQQGVGQVSVSEWCTKHDLIFHSYRRDGPASGRMVAYLGRPMAA